MIFNFEDVNDCLSCVIGLQWHLEQSYEPRYYYMEVVLLVYRLIMSAVVVLFMPDTMAQVRGLAHPGCPKLLHT